MNYKMTIHPAVEAGSASKVFLFETAEQMVVSKDVAANLLLFIQDIMQVMPDYSNMFIMEQMVDGEWVEYDEDF